MTGIQSRLKCNSIKSYHHHDVQAVSNASRMYWQTGFGRFRGMSGIPRGKISLQALEGIDGLEQPSSLHYDEPLASYIDIPDEL